MGNFDHIKIINHFFFDFGNGTEQNIVLVEEKGFLWKKKKIMEYYTNRISMCQPLGSICLVWKSIYIEYRMYLVLLVSGVWLEVYTVFRLFIALIFHPIYFILLKWINPIIFMFIFINFIAITLLFTLTYQILINE